MVHRGSFLAVKTVEYLIFVEDYVFLASSGVVEDAMAAQSSVFNSF